MFQLKVCHLHHRGIKLIAIRCARKHTWTSSSRGAQKKAEGAVGGDELGEDPGKPDGGPVGVNLSWF